MLICNKHTLTTSWPVIEQKLCYVITVCLYAWFRFFNIFFMTKQNTPKRLHSAAVCTLEKNINSVAWFYRLRKRVFRSILFTKNIVENRCADYGKIVRDINSYVIHVLLCYIAIVVCWTWNDEIQTYVSCTAAYITAVSITH